MTQILLNEKDISQRRPYNKIKLKIYNKYYSLQYTPLYKLIYINRICKLFCISKQVLSYLIHRKENFFQKSRGRDRLFIYPIGELQYFHNKMASFLRRIEVPEYIHSNKNKFSYISNAQQHINQVEVLKVDLTSFFDNTTKTMIFRFFRNKLECSHQIANIFADLCTTSQSIVKTSKEPCLPTGSQLSMSLSYWANVDMFDELYTLAEENKLIMTVYVDDITFSGAKIPKGFIVLIRNVVSKYGHSVKENKTRKYILNQPKKITGIMLHKGNLILPKEKMLELHNKLSLWKSLLRDNDLEGLNKQYLSLLSLIGFVSHFKPSYRYLHKKIKAELNSIKSMNHKKANEDNMIKQFDLC